MWRWLFLLSVSVSRMCISKVIAAGIGLALAFLVSRMYISKARAAGIGVELAFLAVCK